MSATVMNQTPPRMDRSVQDIISSARTAIKGSVTRVGVAGALAMSFLSGLLMWLSFTPVNASPLAWIAPIPLLLLVRIQERTRWMYQAIYLGGLVTQLATLQWMRLGDPTMYFAWAALSIYLAVYSVMFVWMSRIAIHRWSIPFVVATPAVWTGLEYLRAHLLTGFAWYFLGHSQYRWLELIQISDLVGAYGVSFVMVMSAAALTLMVPHAWLIRSRLELPTTGPTTATGLTLSQLIQIVATVAVFGSVLGYGAVRRSQADFRPGPRVALIQGNFVASLREVSSSETIHLTHTKLTGLAVREQPEIIVWPEGMFPWPMMSAANDVTDEQLRELVPSVPPAAWRDKSVATILAKESERAGAALIFGINHSAANAQEIDQRNSAVFVRPDTGISGRYDKMHLVPFGEYIPLKSTIPLLKIFDPYNGKVSMNPGSGPAVFEYHGWHLAPVICFEDTVPHLVRRVVAEGKSSGQSGVDLLINLTNDGWFHGSSELDQHLITAAFRTVECRTPMVRAVNTGISAVIDGDGAIRDPEVFIDGDFKTRGSKPWTSIRDPETGAWRRQVNAAIVDTVPLDSRHSCYVQYGDWFAMGCGSMALFMPLSLLLTLVGTRTRKAH